MIDELRDPTLLSATVTSTHGRIEPRALPRQSVAILGSRGIPAQHGGFETFAEALALHLVDRGWRVTVYCQGDPGRGTRTDVWRRVERVHLAPGPSGPLGTIHFDLKSTWHAIRHRPGVVLTLGYNTALFCALYRLAGVTNVINMDGLEWQRSKWSRWVRGWFYVNERLGCLLGNQLIADHPEMKVHLATRVRPEKIVTIAYGANEVAHADNAILATLGLESDGYALVVARPEPENSILELVTAFSRGPRNRKLVVLGRLDPDRHRYHRSVRDAAGPEVIFPGAIYDKAQVEALRFHCHFYVHGHQVGGTNPSLVEALGAGCAILAHDNRFNRWVAGPDAKYFRSTDDCAALMDTMLGNQPVLSHMRAASRERHRSAFNWSDVLEAYESVLSRWHRKVRASGEPTHASR